MRNNRKYSGKKLTEDMENDFRQCKRCGVFLLSQTAEGNHAKLCRNSKRNDKGKHAHTDTRTVTFPTTFVRLRRVSPQNGVTKHHKLKTGRQRKNGHVSTLTKQPSRSTTSSLRKIVKKYNGNRKRKRMGGMSLLLKSLGVESMAEVHRTSSTPRMSSLAAKEKLQSVCKELNEVNPYPAKRSTSIKNAVNKRRKRLSSPHSLDGDDDDEDGLYLPNAGDKGTHVKSHKPTARKGQKSSLADSWYIHNCTKCSAKFHSPTLLNQHLKIHESGNENFTCPICEKAFAVRSHYTSHLDRHIHAEAIEKAFNLWETWPERPGGPNNSWEHRFPCKFCLIRHYTQVSFLSHMKEQHPGKTKDSKFLCQYSCDVISDSIKAFVRHIKDQHKEKYFCRKQEKISWGKDTTPNEENKWRDPDQPVKYVYLSKCDICEKNINAYHLPEHKKSHERREKILKTSRFSCPICSTGLKDRYNLRRHFVLHLENNPFVCRFPGCGQKFQDEYYLESHVNRHLSNFITCDKCNITYRGHLKKRHKCVFDETKTKVGEDGRKYLKGVRFDGITNVSSLPTGIEALGLSKVSTSTKSVEEVNDKEVGKSTNNIKTENIDDDANRFEVESVHFVDKIIETEDGTVHVKGEQLSPIRTDTEMDGAVVSNPDPSSSMSTQPESTQNRLLSGKDRRYSSSVTILRLILDDPVYHRIIEEKPEFAKMIEGNVYKLTGKSFRCLTCSASFSRFSTLEKHKETCVDETNDGVGRQVETNKGPDAVMQTITLLCGSCGYQSSSKEDLKHHMKTAPDHGSSGKYRCIFKGCGIPFETEEALNKHAKLVHLAEKKFKCDHDTCGKAFSTKITLNNHTKNVHGFSAKDIKEMEKGGKKLSLKCTKCDTDFEDIASFVKHKREHRNTKLPTAKCQICGDEFAGRHSLKRHIILVHTKSNKISQKPVECDETRDRSDVNDAPAILGV